MNFFMIAIMCFSMSELKAQTQIEEELAPEMGAQTETQVLTAEPINVDGYVKEAPAKTTDGELESLRSEIQKQKKEAALNTKKAKSYQELSQSVEKLSETTEEYLLEKKAAQEEIANYNLKVKCLSADVPGPGCEKFVKRRN